MKQIWKELNQWVTEKREFVVARVTETWRSAPRKAGATMIIDKAMNVAGSVSGGCIEGAVIQEAQQVFETGIPRTVSFGVEDDTAWSVGLSCGGTVEVHLELHWSAHPSPEAPKLWSAVCDAVESKRTLCLLSKIEEKESSSMVVYADGETCSPWAEWDDDLKKQCIERMGQQKSGMVEWQGHRVFIQTLPAPDQLIIIGAGHISLSLVTLADAMGLETYVMDPRKVFSDEKRFSTPPTQLLTTWPHEVLETWNFSDNSYLVFLTHDPKIDDPSLKLVMSRGVRYIGALGSRKTHAKRCQRLSEAGFSESEIQQIHAPIGLNIGAETPQEIALSIISEIIQVKRCG